MLKNKSSGFLHFRVLILIFLFCSMQAWAFDSYKLDFKKELSQIKTVNLYDKSKSSGLSDLELIKKAQIENQNESCLQLVQKKGLVNKELRGWVVLVALQCGSRSEKSSDFALALSILQNNSALLYQGPWAKDLIGEFNALSLKVVQNFLNDKNKSIKSKTAAKDIDKTCELVLAHPTLTNKDLKASCFQILAEAALQQKAYEKAYGFFLQSYENKAQKNILDQLESLKNSLKTSPSVLAKEKKSKLAAPSIGVSLEDEDVGKILEQAQASHRRAEYTNSQNFVEQIIGLKLPRSLRQSLLWLNGRNLQFLGKYEKALVPFDELAIKFAGSDESFEALLRMGLIQLRLKNYAAATAVFSRYLSSSDSAAKSKYELSVKYWRIRSMQLQKQENKVSQVDGIDVLIEELIREYPFSYYGLRLWSEQNQGALPDFAENKSLFKNPQAVAVWLVGEQKKAWSRFKILAQSGWWSEALSELSLIPQLQDTNYKLLLAYFLSSHHLYQPAIRLVNELMDENEVLRNKTVLQLGFPKVFIEDFQQQAAKYRLSPYLLRSLTRQESAYNVRAVSSSNALGLMQLIPPTAMDVARSLSLKSLKVPEDLFRPSINIAMGSFYINQMLQEFSYNVPMALAAYNAGPSRMKIWLDLRPEVKSQRDQASSMPMDEIWFDELPWNESSFYIKAILRNVMLYPALENHSIKLKPVLWQDLVEKKSDRGG